MLLQDTLIEFLTLAQNAGCNRIVVAYSGGIDSHVMLTLLNQLNQNKEQPLPLDAVYINHNIHKDSASWGDHCRAICQSLSIPFMKIDVDAKPEKGESPEEKARNLRYQAFSGEMQAEDWLVTAQHMEDQTETLLLQLMRGSGATGLSAMPTKRSLGKGEHHRPFLNVSKQQIESYATEHALQWIDDPSNTDMTISRNYLRSSVLPIIKRHWPEATKLINRSAAWLAESTELMEDLAKQDFDQCSEETISLNIGEMTKLSHVRQKNLLRYWFHISGLKRPGNEKLTLIFQQIVNAKNDAVPYLKWQESRLMRYNQKLYLVPEWPTIDPQWRLKWDAQSSVSLSGDWAVLNVERFLGKGLSPRFLKQHVTLQLRGGGEQCQPTERARNRSLKKLFQEYSVPPWLRHRWPLLYWGEKLIAVPGLFVCKGYEANDAEEGLWFSLNVRNVNE